MHARHPRAATATILALFTLPVFAGLVQGGDPLKDAKSKDPAVRAAAIEALVARGDDKATSALTKLLGDDDWGIAEDAATALGKLEVRGARTALGRLALDGPTERLRSAAVLAWAAIDPESCTAQLTKKAVSRGDAHHACQGLAVLAGVLKYDSPESALLKALKSKEAVVRRAAASAIGALAGDERGEFLERAFADESVGVAASALSGLLQRPLPGDAGILAGLMGGGPLNDVLERRLIAASWACLAAASEEGDDGLRAAKEALLAGLDKAATPEVAARAIQLAAAMLTEDPDGLGAEVIDPLATLLDHGQDDIRAQAAAALARGPWSKVGSHLESKVDTERSARVRRALVVGSASGGKDTLALLEKVVTSDAAAEVREAAAVALGDDAYADAVPALAQALGDTSWRVAACAAVSIGKTRDIGALTPLTNLLEHTDWRLRGAAVMGLGHLAQKPGIRPLISALQDPEPAVSRTAHEALQLLLRRSLPKDPTVWTEFWDKSERSFTMRSREELQEQREKYGYAQSARDVYKDLDVIVLQSRGDHIELLLDRIGIAHERTSQAHVRDAALHPSAIYVSNCTGELLPADLERVEWFVVCGGYLFGSCWSLGHTIEKIEPGVARMYPKHMEGSILDDVSAEQATPASPYLEGVFPDHVRPIYHLEGSHLIEVMKPERCEVLIDSPECATRWGCGNLAVWFRSGHGLILDSANHFDLQGLETAGSLKKPADRQAYAVDHLGLEPEDLRKIVDEKFWKSNHEAARHVFDESAFRFITNFVRKKRLDG